MSKRQFGAIRRLPSGRYQARYRDPGAGRLVAAPLTFERKADAARWLSTIEADLARGVWLDPKPAQGLTVAAWAERWLRSDPNKRPSTVARDQQALDQFLPSLGAKPLAAVTTHDVRAVIDDLVPRQAPATVRRNVASLKAMFNAAVAEDLIPRTPVRGLRLPRIDPKAHPELTAADLLRLVDAVPARYRAVVLLAGVLGLRWGEIAGLQLEDVDFLRRQVHVRRQLAELAGTLTVQETKTDRGHRSLAAPTFVIEALAVHIQQYRAGAGGDEPLFTGPRGGLLRRNFLARVLRPAAVEVGLPGAVTTHGLRHVATSLMVEAGEHPRVMQRRLGHADPRLTLGLYAHASDEADAASARRLETLFRDEAAGGLETGS